MATTRSTISLRSIRASACNARSATLLLCGLVLCIGIGVLTSTARAEAAQVCNLYASNGGNDSNPGSASAPLQTVKALIGKLAAGQTGCLTSGQTFAGFTIYAGGSHGAEGAPVTITSTDPSAPATINTRITTTSGANWLTFSHLNISSDVLSSNEDPSPTINSAHTSWTYDDISGGDINICILPSAPTEYGAAEYTLIEHDRVHDCGHSVTAAEEAAQGASDMFEGRLNGYHAHGVYDEGFHTTIRNNYFYENASKGILLRGGSYAVVEHNIIDHNGSGVLFGDNGPNHDVVAWNIVSNSTSPCGRETGFCDDFGVWSYCQGSCPANSFVNNDVFGNKDGNIAPSYGLCSCIEVRNNIEADPLYVNAAAHEYALQPRSPAVGYGPDTAQPSASAALAREASRGSAPHSSSPAHHTKPASSVRAADSGSSTQRETRAKRARRHRHAKVRVHRRRHHPRGLHHHKHPKR